MTLEHAIQIAAAAHAGVPDKSDLPYILHPLRIMLKMTTADERVAAVLHDVVEDTAVSLDQLQSDGLAGEALEAVRLLTKEKGVDYKVESNLMAYLGPIKEHSVARAVKLGDLEDNLNVLRLKAVTPEDGKRLDGYLMARRFLLS